MRLVSHQDAFGRMLGENGHPGPRPDGTNRLPYRVQG